MKHLSLNSNQIELLKWIALILMLGDHYSSIYIEDPFHILKITGRLVFPLFSIILVYNYIYNTSNKLNFIKRLFIFAILSEPIHYFAFKDYFNNIWILNIFFTLTFGLLILYIFENTISFSKIKKTFIYLCLILIFIPISLKLSYELTGLTLILITYYFLKKNSLLSLFLLSINIYILNIFYDIKISFIGLFVILLCYIIPSINIKRINKWFFYLFYPIHLLLLKLTIFFI